MVVGVANLDREWTDITTKKSEHVTKERIARVTICIDYVKAI